MIVSDGKLNSGGCQVIVTQVALWLAMANECGCDVTADTPWPKSESIKKNSEITIYLHLKKALYFV